MGGWRITHADGHASDGHLPELLFCNRKSFIHTQALGTKDRHVHTVCYYAHFSPPPLPHVTLHYTGDPTWRRLSASLGAKARTSASSRHQCLSGTPGGRMWCSRPSGRMNDHVLNRSSPTVSSSKPCNSPPTVKRIVMPCLSAISIGQGFPAFAHRQTSSRA